MIDFALNRNDKDIVYKVNAQGFAEYFMIDGADRIRQSIEISLKTWLGDWFLDTSQGIPYLQVIFPKQTRNSTREAIVRAAIMAVEGVERILDFALKVDAATRVLRIDFECETAQGPVKGSTLLDQIR